VASATEPDPLNAPANLLHPRGWQIAMIGLGTATAQLDTSVNIAFPAVAGRLIERQISPQWTEQTPIILRIAGLVVRSVGLGLFQLAYA
jgi:hypothetical protein